MSNSNHLFCEPLEDRVVMSASMIDTAFPMESAAIRAIVVKKASGWVGKFSGTGLGYDTVGPYKVKQSFTLTLKTVSAGKVAGSVKTKWGTVSFNTINVSLQNSYLIFLYQRWDGAANAAGQLHLSKDGRTVQGELDVLANGHNLMFDVKLKRK